MYKINGCTVIEPNDLCMTRLETGDIVLLNKKEVEIMDIKKGSLITENGKIKIVEKMVTVLNLELNHIAPYGNDQFKL